MLAGAEALLLPIAFVCLGLASSIGNYGATMAVYK